MFIFIGEELLSSALIVISASLAEDTSSSALNFFIVRSPSDTPANSWPRIMMSRPWAPRFLSSVEKAVHIPMFCLSLIVFPFRSSSMWLSRLSSPCIAAVFLRASAHHSDIS